MSWSARFIAADEEFDGAPLLTRDVVLERGHGAVATAELFLSALGVCEASIDGQPVSADVLTPGWTSYEWRLRYALHDVGHLLGAPCSTLAIRLGNGWYRGRLGWGDGATPYGPELAAFAELRIAYQDGHEQVIVTDESWRSSASDTTANDLYDGQDIDARRRDAQPESRGDGEDSSAGVHVVPYDLQKLEPYMGPAIRRHEERTAEAVWLSPSGKILLDFGQNLVGWVRTEVEGPAGTTVTLRHAEVLEHDELGVRPLRTAKATDRFTLSGKHDVFEPTLTFHGFRYVEVEGWPGGIDALDRGALTAVVVSSDLRRTGRFSSSDPLLNQLHQNVVWGMRGNFLDVPTDCPQRDERLGWTGDIAAFAPTAAFLSDSKDFLRSWLRDVSLEQSHHDGVVPFVVPDVLKYMEHPPEFAPFNSTAVWSDAAVWVPWALYQAYGDPAILEDAFPSMAAHVRRVGSLLSASGVWDQGFQFGDWLDPDAPPARPADAKADKGVVATACAFRSATMLADSARVLCLTNEELEFKDQAETLRASFYAAYVADDRILSDCTTVYSLAITFGLLRPEDLPWAGDRLAELVTDSGFRISTGFAGTPFITDALSSTGHIDEAYKLLLQKESPSWLYPVTMGATTVWERWDSMLPDGSINPGEMTSFNHYALGAVADWLHRVVGGLAPLEPGYRRILVAPQPGGSLEWAESTLETPHGLASVRWDRHEDEITVVASIPEGTTAVIRLPGLAESEVSSGLHTFSIEAATTAHT
jgi:alpha-L-rhamnosidase